MSSDSEPIRFSEDELNLSHLERGELAADLGRRAMELLIEKAAPPSSSFEDLTKTEREILELLSHGLSNKEMAKARWTTEQTIKFHLRNIYQKLGVKNRTQAAHLFLQVGAEGHGVNAATLDSRLREAATLLIKGSVLLASVPADVAIPPGTTSYAVSQSGELIAWPPEEIEKETHSAESYLRRYSPKQDEIIDIFLNSAGTPLTYKDFGEQLYSNEEDIPITQKINRATTLLNAKFEKIKVQLENQGFTVKKALADNGRGRTKVLLTCIPLETSEIT